jgi:hypothetical protein
MPLSPEEPESGLPYMGYVAPVLFIWLGVGLLCLEIGVLSSPSLVGTVFSVGVIAVGGFMAWRHCRSTTPDLTIDDDPLPLWLQALFVRTHMVSIAFVTVLVSMYVARRLALDYEWALREAEQKYGWALRGAEAVVPVARRRSNYLYWLTVLFFPVSGLLGLLALEWKRRSTRQRIPTIGRSTISERLERLSHRLRVAFAAGCAGRVLRIYELDYSKENRSPHAAVDIAWRFACGEQIPEQTFSDTFDAAEDAIPGDEYSGPMRASLSAICALDAVEDPTAAAAAATYALEAIGTFEDHKGEGEAAEEKWQEQALKLVESWGAQPIVRNMFVVLGDDPPAWFPWPKR